ncbi:hypothetical protein HYALB_00000007 [Hymenoscyphus albidus]|uniref:tRNA(Ile)-lysidine synthetase n=1 Tax=Hymenoscyphus albidus TaxID=595503 RepID=A0A9N9LGE1_9HELO|nr:hypothetical protein HYALB_00000007 [Hymenoscyphus albidus]
MSATVRSGFRALLDVKASLPEGRPIDVAEFGKALTELYGPGLLGKDGAHPSGKLGLAISGGVDSMALAALYSRLRLQNDAMPDVHAFVVDHGAREGSADEANSVAKVLAERGIQTRVLQIDWGGPRKPTNFETQARKFRYRTLGKACRDLGIRSLLVAHHEDDQAETVVMRLLKGHPTQGLRGMKPYAPIPECRGIYGVHQGGGDVEETFSYQNTLLSKLPFPPQLPTASGGIKLLRPLLSFSKSRLIATCQAEKMKWFEDATNKDPTLTQRNAIRHAYNSNKMPAALSKSDVLQLAERAKDIFLTQQEIADSYLSRCEISDFQTRSGILKIRFPTLDLPTDLPLDQKIFIATNIIRNVIKLVAPHEILASDLELTIKRIFPELFPNEDIKRVLSSTVEMVVILQHPEESQTNKPYYTISRSPFARTRHPIYTFPLPEINLTSESLETPDPQAQTQEIPWSEWHLFDGRYWIRIKNKTSHRIQLRPFKTTELKAFAANLSPSSVEKLFQLSPILPRHIKWTLPCLVLQPESPEEKVLALPSLHIGIKDVENYIDYEIKYKKIYWGALSTERVDLCQTPSVREKPPARWLALGLQKSSSSEQPLVRPHWSGYEDVRFHMTNYDEKSYSSEQRLVRYQKRFGPKIQFKYSPEVTPEPDVEKGEKGEKGVVRKVALTKVRKLDDIPKDDHVPMMQTPLEASAPIRKSYTTGSKFLT